ncbi:MAG: SCP2 sterol-binding domain-containing protein [Porticoccaceae bacterium]
MIAALARQQAARLVNLALEQNPAARERLTGLGDLHINIHVTQPRATLALRIHAGVVAIEPAADEPADLELAGSVPALLHLAANPDTPIPGAPFPGTITVTGDPALCARLRAIQTELELDWEGKLAAHVGDTSAHLLGSGVRSVLRGGNEVLTRSRELLVNYLAEESPAMPPGPLHGMARAGAEAALAFADWLGASATSAAPTSAAPTSATPPAATPSADDSR